MKYLLDTHVFLWSLESNQVIPNHIVKILEDGCVTIFISMASLWEMAIKMQIKKLKLPKNIQLKEIVQQSFFELLNINVEHIDNLRQLKAVHRDPFDHLLVSQAKAENLILITHDSIFKKYLKPKNLLLF